MPCPYTWEDKISHYSMDVYTIAVPWDRAQMPVGMSKEGGWRATTLHGIPRFVYTQKRTTGPSEA